jgi:hypothetical protein
MALRGTKDSLAVLLAALWWGSLTSIGFLVVPMLFAYLPTPAMAGNMAARLFSAETWVSVTCGMLILLISGSNRAYSGVRWPSYAIGLIAFSMLMALLVEFGVAPRIVARDNLKLWHGVGSALFGLQWMGTGLLLWRLARQKAA